MSIIGSRALRPCGITDVEILTIDGLITRANSTNKFAGSGSDNFKTGGVFGKVWA